MEPVHIFYKELLADKNNVFTVNISEKNEMENVKFRKSQEYGFTGIPIKPDIGNLPVVKITHEIKLEFLSQKIQELVECKKDPDVDLKISHNESKNLIRPFKKNKKGLSSYKTYFLRNQQR